MLLEKGINKKDLSRDEFLEYAWKWKEKYGGTIINQLQKLGCSCDWDKTNFTMDSHYSKAVLESFVRLYNKGLIYKGSKLVNWCPKSQTALSDEEVMFKEVNGKLWHIKYAINDSDSFIEIATTRPETMLGDTAIAVNPKDNRYKKMIGKTASLPLVGRNIPIIADSMVDPEFGTGCVKITPAHDLNDYEVGIRHNLEVINIMNSDGSISNKAPDKYVGMSREDARKEIVNNLKDLGCLTKEEDYLHKVGFSERGNVPIEYYLSEQWFLKMKNLAKPASKAVKDKEINFYPNHWVKTYNHWMDNIQDWCISRQLYWGHQIPVWYKKDADRANQENWYISTTPPPDIENWEQDEDVLDTWFSSWLWPFAVHGWPDKEKTNYFPTNALVTGPDIIFFWVARMIMSGYEFMGDLPFKDVYFTSILRDEKGRKLSKSLGNSPDPITLFDKYGTDATRFSIMLMSPQGSDVYFSESGIEVGRNFMTKIWNASRFIMLNHNEDFSDEIDYDNIDNFDKWILSSLDDTIREVNKSFDKYQFNEAIKKIYDFTWNEFCNWYIEIVKDRFNSSNLSLRSNAFNISKHIIKKILLLLHPISPFISEEIWNHLKDKDDRDIIISQWPSTSSRVKSYDVDSIKDFKEIVTSIRTIRSELNIAPSKKIDIIVSVKSDSEINAINHYRHLISKLSNTDKIDLGIKIEKPSNSAIAVCRIAEIYIPLGELVDKKEEILKLNKRLSELDKLIVSIEAKLSNKQFIDKAPEKVVDGEKNKLNDFIIEREKILSNIEVLK
jgi:valyl-tRNA synthetase